MKINQRHISTVALYFGVGLFTLNAYALPPQAEADKLQIEAKAAMEAKNYAVATGKFARMEKLKARLPATFAYHYGVALTNTGEFARAKEQLDKYITKAGANGKFYKEALEMYAKTEEYEAAALIQIQKDREYQKRMDVYKIKKARYDDIYKAYRQAANACDESTSRKWRYEACTFRIPDGIHDINAWLDNCANHIKLDTTACRNVPERPVEPDMPRHE